MLPVQRLSYPHDCVDALQKPGLNWQRLPPEQVVGAALSQVGPAVHAPPWQVSLRVYCLMSSQAVPSGLDIAAGQPVAGLQVPMVWHWSVVQLTVFPTQLPDWQLSLSVQALPSLHAVPLAMLKQTHAPPEQRGVLHCAQG